ncbi:permease-like cell division protein FtsX [uncultured Flavobacterium sp.]|uniref:cell division protein FtsX n=1 Tax=uncultured Flavobacterium sp. TaxID=165435 RepID=UPI0030CA445F
MASSFEKYNKRRLISSYFSVILSIFLVLFLLGGLGLFVINSKKLTNDFKEKIQMTVFFKNDAKERDLKAFDLELKNSEYIKKYLYINKDSAVKNNVDIFGEDFLEYVGQNPIKNSFDINLKGDYVQADSIKKIETQIKKNELVSEIIYDKILVDLVNDNVRKISLWLLIVSIILSFVAMLLINSSLRLSIYSHRFTIKTMQMVGATKSFIRKPFILRSIKLGLIGSALAVIALLILVCYIDSKLPDLGILKDYLSIGVVMAGVFIVGIIITSISTYFATQRFLNLKTEDLY